MMSSRYLNSSLNLVSSRNRWVINLAFALHSIGIVDSKYLTPYDKFYLLSWWVMGEIREASAPFTK